MQEMNTYWANISSDVVYESGKAADDYCNHAMAIYRHIKTVTQSSLSDAIFFFQDLHLILFWTQKCREACLLVGAPPQLHPYPLVTL